MKKIRIIKYALLIVVAILWTSATVPHAKQYNLVEWIIVGSIPVYLLAGIFVAFTAIEKSMERKRNQPKPAPIVEPVQQKPVVVPPVEHVKAEYIETKNGIRRVDGKPFTDEEIPFLMQRDYEKAMEKHEFPKKVNPKFSRTDRESDLAYNFETKHGAMIDRETKKFMDLYREADFVCDLDERLEILYRCKDAFLTVRDLFYSKGKGATIYFQDWYEYMHNSQSDCFSYLDLIDDAIKKTKWIKDVVIPDILDAIRQNDGILQKNLYSLLPHIEKGEIQAFLKASDDVLRVKKGSTYELHLKNNDEEKG